MLQAMEAGDRFADRWGGRFTYLGRFSGRSHFATDEGELLLAPAADGTLKTPDDDILAEMLAAFDLFSSLSSASPYRMLWMHFAENREELVHLAPGGRIALVGMLAEIGGSGMRLYGCERILG